MSHSELGFVPTLANLAGRIRSSDVVLDIGAYRGMMTEELRKIYPDSSFHLFEPLPHWAETLSDRYRRNDRISVHSMAVSDQDGSAHFQVGAFEPTSSLFPRNRTGARYYHADYEMVSEIEVQTKTLDTFCAEHSLDRIACLKMDTQGAELKILTGAKNSLGRGAIDIVMTEWFGVPHYEDAPDFHDIWSALARHGYSMLNIFPGPTAPNGQLRYGDAIFVSPSVRRDYLSEAG